MSAVKACIDAAVRQNVAAGFLVLRDDGPVAPVGITVSIEWASSATGWAPCQNCHSHGEHAEWCLHSQRGPSEPPPTQRAECPCGIHRDDCEYHRPSNAGAA